MTATPTAMALLAGLSLTLFAPTLPAQAPAEDTAITQLGTHEHGKVVVNLALEGGTLSAELDSPAMNVIGFERAPRNATERKFVAEIDRWLGSGVGMLGVPGTAGCALGRVDYTPPKLGGKADDHAHDHDHKNKHEHEHEASDGSAHADYEARFTYNCTNPAALEWVDLRLLRRLQNVTQVEVNLVTPAKQTQLKVTGATPRVSLK